MHRAGIAQVASHAGEGAGGMRMHCAKFVDLAGTFCREATSRRAVGGRRYAAAISELRPVPPTPACRFVFRPRNPHLVSRTKRISQSVDLTTNLHYSPTVRDVSASVPDVFRLQCFDSAVITAYFRRTGRTRHVPLQSQAARARYPRRSQTIEGCHFACGPWARAALHPVPTHARQVLRRVSTISLRPDRQLKGRRPEGF